MNTRLLVRTVSALLLVFIGLLITGCASSSSEEVQREYQTTLEGFLREYAKDEYDGSVKGNDLLAIWCSKSKEETLSFLEDLLYVQAAREKFLNQLNPNTEFMRWTSACNIVINERPGAYEALIAEKEEKKVASEKARVASVKFQKELDVLDKKCDTHGHIFVRYISNSSAISPTISSIISSIVIMPAVPPYSSTTIAKWI